MLRDLEAFLRYFTLIAVRFYLLTYLLTYLLSGSNGRTFRIGHEKSREAPPGVEITMTACNKSTLSRKPCIVDKKVTIDYYQEVMIALFRIHYKRLPEAPPGVEIKMTSYPAGNNTSLYRKPCIPDKMLLWNTMRKSWPLFQNPS